MCGGIAPPAANEKKTKEGRPEHEANTTSALPATVSQLGSNVILPHLLGSSLRNGQDKDDLEHIDSLSVYSSSTLFTTTTLSHQPGLQVSRSSGSLLDMVIFPFWDQMFPCCTRRMKVGREGLEAMKRHMTHQGSPRPQKLTDGTYVTAKYWGITKPQLQTLFDMHRGDQKWLDTDNVRDFVQKFVRPATEHGEMGMALRMNQECPQEVTLMISHAWEENCKTFFEDVIENMEDHEVAYICFLSNFQGTDEQIEAQLGDDIHSSPFSQVLQNSACKRMLVVPNETLKRNGEGLYSRLWCDWEIKVAADLGLPIFIVRKYCCNKNYLISSGGSINARCGLKTRPMNNDEKRIRKAIISLPTQTVKFQAIWLFVFTCCTAFTPTILFNIFRGSSSEAKHAAYKAWLCGFPLGILIGWGVSSLLSPFFRALYNRMRGKNKTGFKLVDAVILGAAEGRYRYRRFVPKQDVLPFVAWSTFVSVIYVAIFQKLSMACFNWGTAWLALEGLGTGALLWPATHMNVLGPWTGVFIARPTMRRMCAFIYLAALACGGLVGQQLSGRFTGPGALAGAIVGLTVVSLIHRAWRNAVGLTIVGLAVAVGMEMQPARWREICMLVLGIGGVLLVPKWSLFKLTALVTIAVILYGALLTAPGEMTRGDLYDHLADGQCGGMLHRLGARVDS
eukprot:TRINITY_DN100561_c0_g1_i1.p1 TRINITY_DN100561_c0_g1~~TRINITY_DN100561_c0_g1_i1.p1  ORF type:complete len:677 (-),score=81.22 TRINITY_DN100561_c0_g1_i1:212-2242(-)